jgi:DNA-binding CsgD family transcriptional regulator
MPGRPCPSRQLKSAFELTKRQSEINQLYQSGLTSEEISKKLSLSVTTVRSQLHLIKDKLRVG